MRPTRRLIVALAGCALLAVASADASWLAGAGWVSLALLLVLAWLDWTRTLREPLPELGFHHPPRCRLREPVEVRYTLRNPRARTLSICLLDERGEALGGDLELGPFTLPPQAQQTLLQTFVPSQRGELTLGPLHGLARSQLGLFEQRLRVRDDRPLLRVLPNPGAGHDAMRGPDAELGARVVRSRGAGLELDTLRRYSEGDDPRHVDWRATARAQQLMVRTFREERNQSLVVAVDAGRMMAARVDGLCKLDHALNTTLALAHAALVHGDRMGFAAFDAEVRSWLPARDPRRGLALLLEATLPLVARPLESSFRVLTELLESSHKKRSLVVILSDFVETADALELSGYLGRLARRHVVLLVALRDPVLSTLDQPADTLDEDTLYRRLVLQDLAAERQLVLRRLTRMGVHTLDLRPEQSRAPVLARYLELRRAL